MEFNECKGSGELQYKRMIKFMICLAIKYVPIFMQAIQSLVMKLQVLDGYQKLIEIQSRLTKYAYFSKEPLPGAADSLIYQKLKNSQKMPSKKQFNFYHWYLTMSQFALKQIDKWGKDKETLEEDKPIIQFLSYLDSLKSKTPLKKPDPRIEYTMSIFLKEPVESNMTVTKNKLLTINPQQIGDEELKISFKGYQERINQSSENSNQLRITFKLQAAACDKLKDIILKWPEVKNFQIKKEMKQKKP